MGNAESSTSIEKSPEDLWWNPISNAPENITLEPATSSQTVSTSESLERYERKKILTKELRDFKRDLHEKHEKGRQIIAQRRKEMMDIQEELEQQKRINDELRQRITQGDSSSASNAEFKMYKQNQERIQTLLTENAELKETIKNMKHQNKNEDENIDELQKENSEIKQVMIEMKEQLKKYDEIAEMNKELRISISQIQDELQSVNVEVLSFEHERQEYKTHVIALKDVIKVSKEMLNIRENQIQELKQKISVIEATLADREVPILAEDLRREYERQLRNIRNLRALYEERERVDKREKESMSALVEETKKALENEQNKNAELQSRIEELETENSTKYDTINNLQSNLGLSKAECKELQAEMAVINQLFSQILVGFNNDQDVDLDKLIKILEENHALLSKIVINEESTEISSALPKTLLDLVNQMNKQKENPSENPEKEEENEDDKTKSDSKLETIVEESESQTSSFQLSSAEEIVQNLPKVWRVLIELLSHQCAPFNNIPEGANKGNENHLYKSVQTPSGTKSVISVSKTFIRLKDLILEKKSLEKETNHLKHLNTHLETRLQSQEKRLEMVSQELSKTWHVVGKMQKQHQQLHTQEKILRYELAQKRKLLTELKEELEYCREKWMQAREKNSSTEAQWKLLRTEFASRKPPIDTSVESGYSDDKSSSDEESSLETDFKKEQDSVKAVIETTNCDSNLVLTPATTLQESSSSDDSILDVVQNEIANIVNNVEEPPSTNEVNHSSSNLEKTDLVQNNERQDIVQNSETNPPSTSNPEQPKINIEEMLARREERLKRMEEQGKELVTKVTNTTRRSTEMHTKLDNLHELYSENSQTQQNPPEENLHTSPINVNERILEGEEINITDSPTSDRENTTQSESDATNNLVNSSANLEQDQ